MDTGANSNESTHSAQVRSQTIAFLISWLSIVAAIFAGIHSQAGKYQLPPAALATILIAFALQFGLYWLPGFPAIREKLGSHFSRPGRALITGGLLILPYIIYGTGTGSLAAVSLGKLSAVAGISLGIYGVIPPRSEKLHWQDLVAMGVIAVPVYGGWYREIWEVPVYLDPMARLFVVGLAAFAFILVRPLDGVGYEWRIKAQDWIEGAKQLALFSIIAIPTGFLINFIALHPLGESIAEFPFSFLTIFLFIAVAEELFFRGILQNLLEKSISNRYLARGIASAVFGFSHIHHGFPNWRYVLMASIAGWFYGTAWHNRKSIMASSITHAAVDALWRQFLRA